MRGVVQNMSFAVCECGRRCHTFVRGGAELLPETTGCAILGQVPFEEVTVIEFAESGIGGSRSAPAQ